MHMKPSVPLEFME